MKRAWLGVALGLVVALVASCTNRSDDDNSTEAVPLPKDLPSCAELFADGKTVDTEQFGRACRTETDDLEVPRYASIECADGSRVLWNEFAWGYDKAPMTLFDPEAAVKIPADQVVECQNGSGGAPTTTTAP